MRAILVAVLLTGCAGIPLSSMPRLMSLQKQLLDLDPAQFMVAIQADARFAPFPGGARGLEPAPADRRWLVYSIPPESQAELAAVQNYFRKLQGEKPKGGGSVAIGISQTGMAAPDPALAGTKWESWLQTSHREGFYEIWSGPVSTLLKQGNL